MTRPQWRRGDEYLYGRDILVAPVVEKGAADAIALPCRAGLVRLLDEAASRRRPGDYAQGRSRDDSALRARRSRDSDGARQAVHGGKCRGAACAMGISRRRRSLFALRRRRKDFRLPEGRVLARQHRWNDRKRRLSAQLATGSKMLPLSTRNFLVHVAGESATREFVFQGRPVEVKL